MIGAAKQNDVMLAVFHNRRHDGNFRAIKEAAHGGAIGDVFHIELSAGHYGRPKTWWYSDKAASGGAFYYWGPHAIDWVLDLVRDRIRGVTGFYHDLVRRDVDIEDQTRAILRFDPTRGYAFSTYAWPSILHHVWRAVKLHTRFWGKEQAECGSARHAEWRLAVCADPETLVAAQAVRRASDFTPFTFDGPVTADVVFTDPSCADTVERLDFVERVDGRAIRLVAEDYLAAFERFSALHCLAPTVR